MQHVRGDLPGVSHVVMPWAQADQVFFVVIAARAARANMMAVQALSTGSVLRA